MIDEAAPLVLGSASPRRREILDMLKIPFVVVTAEVDEAVAEGEDPDTYLRRVVLRKLAAVARLEASRRRTILVADTSVVVEGAILGKPRDRAEAEEMISLLSGRWHEVKTRFALAHAETAEVALHEETVVTRVLFRPLSTDERRRYAATGEGMDKAGAYAIQGIGSFAVARIEGSYPNVVGLPACEVVMALKALGLLGAFPR